MYHNFRLHNDFPLFPSNVEITQTDLSPYSLDVLKMLGKITKSGEYSSVKLCATLRDKIEYTAHWRYIRLGLELGLKLKKIHKILKFRQSDFCAGYIAKCMQARAKATSKFEKQLYKTVQNSLFGKFIEGIRGRVDCKIAKSRNTLLRQCGESTYKSIRLVNQNVALTFHRKDEICLDKFPATGAAILDLARWFMYSSYYKHMLPVFGPTTRIILSDTDSIGVFFKSVLSKREIMTKLKDLMDFSNYPEDDPLFSPDRRNLTGYFKDETGNICEYSVIISLAPKLYRISTQPIHHSAGSNEGGIVKCRGIPSRVSQTFSEEDFRKCLFENQQIHKDYNEIRSNNMVLTTHQVNRLALTNVENKRFWLCAIHSLAYGSALIKTIKNGECLFCKEDLEYEKARQEKKDAMSENESLAKKPKIMLN